MGAIIDKLLRHPVISSVLAAAIVAAFSKFLGWWPSISVGLNATWNFISEPVAIPVWLLTLLVLFTFGLFLLLYMLRKRVESETDSHVSYVKDEFYGIKWRWGYYSNGSLKKPVPFCLNCDFQLVPRFSSAYRSIDMWSFRCENCGHNPPVVEEPLNSFKDRVERQIQLRIRNGATEEFS